MVDVSEEIQNLKKSNSRNNIIILVLLVILAFVSIMAIYIRFFAK